MSELHIHVSVGAADEIERDFRLMQRAAQLVRRGEQLGSGIGVKAGKDVRRAGDGRDALDNCHTRHFKRRFEIARAVIQARQYVAVKIDHGVQLIANCRR